MPGHIAHRDKKGPCCRRNKEQIFPLVIERIFQKYAIIEEIKVAVDTPWLPNAGSTAEKYNQSLYRAYFLGEVEEKNTKEDVRQLADKMQDQES